MDDFESKRVQKLRGKTMVHQEKAEMSKLREQVLKFHERFGQSIGEKPHVPDEKTVSFRLSLIAEEFVELLGACYPNNPGALGNIRDEIDNLMLYGTIEVDLPEFVDALADLDYVIEGTRITFGVNGDPIADEVHRANMSKMPSYVAEKDAMHQGAVKRADGKIMKPPGFVPPDILGVLKKQGYEP